MRLNCKMIFTWIWWTGHRKICFLLAYTLVCISGVHVTVKFVLAYIFIFFIYEFFAEYQIMKDKAC